MAKAKQMKAPRWLYDRDTPETLVMHRRLARTPEEKCHKAIAAKMGWSVKKLDRDIFRIRATARGKAPVDHPTERQAAALFLETWDAYGPTDKERLEMMRAGQRAKGLSQAAAASAVQRMAQLRRKHLNGSTGQPRAA